MYNGSVMAKENTKAKVVEALGDPVLADMPDEMRKTKRNLLLVSSGVIFASLSGIKVTQAGFLWFQFTSPDQFWLNAALLGMVLYFIVQFVWQAVDYVAHTRIRITGSRISHVTGARVGSQHADYPDDPRQSSLYQWWKANARQIGDLRDRTIRLDNQIALVEELARHPDAGRSNNAVEYTNAVGQLRTVSSEISRSLEHLTGTLQAERIPVSLDRFDKWYGFFSKSQVWRLWILDLILPLVLSLTAIALIFVTQ